ncbi:hypothetical protein SELMODRAFT_418360 [Selaginella moellendorffii]|uniref:Uncharacterized protein n=1 Tax=Selaginella moellendorffii TaxID=88036 RepID=D8S5G8_SELML|nr:hypothetical protein SELMODRAFT_418360 [Selaginella moellendorffii]
MDSDESDEDDGWSASVRIITPLDMDATVTFSDVDDGPSHCCHHHHHDCHREIASSRDAIDLIGPPDPDPEYRDDHDDNVCPDCKDSHILEWSGGPSLPRTYREVCPAGQCDQSSISLIDSSLPRPYNPPVSNPHSSTASNTSAEDQEVDRITIRASERDIDHITIRARSRSPERVTVSVTDHHCCPEHPCSSSQSRDRSSSPSGAVDRIRILVDSEVDHKMGQLRSEIGALDDRLGDRIERAIDSVVASKLMDITDCTSERVLRRINCMIDCKMKEAMEMADCAVNSRLRDALEAVMKDLQRCKNRLNS